MKLLMFDTNEFWYQTFSKTLELASDATETGRHEDALVVFVNVEAEDEAAGDKAVKKAADNIAWLARKNSRTKIVLHSFAHLSESKSSPEFAQKVLGAVGERLRAKGLEVSQTPFGYFLEFKIHVRGESLAKVWKAI